MAKNRDDTEVERKSDKDVVSGTDVEVSLGWTIAASLSLFIIGTLFGGKYVKL